MTGIVMAEAGGDFPAKLTGQVITCSIIAAIGGLMFGYDIGISGGVTSMDTFLKLFFHTVYEKKHKAKENNYCKYDSQYLQLFTSSLYLAAILASFVASIFSKKYGRKRTMQFASIFFLCGAALNAGAQNLIMLIVGRFLLGAGVGFGNTAVPLFISEIAPAKYRGGLNACFQMMITIGILGASYINYLTSKLHYGWRLSLGLAGVPALCLLIGSIRIVETPTSLIERNQKEKGLAILKKIRGTDNVDAEYQEILRAVEFSKKTKNPHREILKRQNRPPLICATLLQVFQQFTGINVVMFYAPVLFQTVGIGNHSSLMSAVIMGVVNTIATIVAILTVDKVGRKVLLLEAALQMIIAQSYIGVMLYSNLHATNSLSKHHALLVVVSVCVYVSGFAWSWGPMCWLVASEVFSLETRNAGYFYAVSTNMICTFVIAQAFLTMLCTMKSYVFFFFAACIVVMACFVAFFLPETKGIPIDEMVERVWKKHWFWKKYYTEVTSTETVTAE